MSCCGQSSAIRMGVSQADIERGLRFEIEYAGVRAIQITGAVTGTSYLFTHSRHAYVDPRDAPAILRDRYFRLKGTIYQGKDPFDEHASRASR